MWYIAIIHKPNTVSKSVYHQCAHVCGSFKLKITFLCFSMSIHLCENNWIESSVIPHFMNKSTLIG